MYYTISSDRCLTPLPHDHVGALAKENRVCEWVRGSGKNRVFLERSNQHSHAWLLEGSHDKGYLFSRHRLALHSLAIVTYIGTMGERTWSSTNNGREIHSPWRYYPTLVENMEWAQRVTVWCPVHPPDRADYELGVFLQMHNTNLWIAIDPATSQFTYTSVPETVHFLTPIRTT